MWDILKFLHDRWRLENPDRQILYPRLASGAGAGGPIEEGTGYFEVFVDRVFLSMERTWGHGQYPTVQAFFTFDFGSGSEGPITIAHAAGPSHLQQVDANHVGRVIQLNHLLCGPVPFRSGSVQMEIALVATPEDDDIKRLLDVLGNFSQLVAVPQLSSALSVASKVADGVKTLAGANGNVLATGLDGTFVGAVGGVPSDYVLRNSLFLAVNAPAKDFDDESLSYSEGRVLYQGNPLVGVDWMLIEIRTFPHRADPVGALDAIGGPLNEAIKALANVTSGDTTAADLFFHSAIAAALTSSDLIQADRLSAAGEVKKRYSKAKSALGLAPVRRRAAVDKARRLPAKPKGVSVRTIGGIQHAELEALLTV